MRKSFELEDSFRSLNHIPRSQIQKRRTYNAILQTSNPKKRDNYIFIHWTGVFLTFALVLTCTALLYTEIVKPAQSQQSAIQPVAQMAAGNVILTYLAKSDSENYFSLQTDLSRKGVSIIEDPSWNKTINSALKSMKPVGEIPAEKMEYDILIVYEEMKPVKYKLSVIGMHVYIKSLKDGQAYKIDDEYAAQIINTINIMQKRVQF